MLPQRQDGDLCHTCLRGSDGVGRANLGQDEGRLGMVSDKVSVRWEESEKLENSASCKKVTAKDGYCQEFQLRAGEP
jgi:hypothetical protein